MLRALHSLRDKGLIKIARGKNARIISGPSPQDNRARRESQSETSIHKLYSKIRNAIMDSTFKKGDQLPKVRYYCVTENVSPNNVCEVMRRLEKEKLIHKRGKRWIVGLRSTPHATYAGAALRPTICILSQSYGLWKHYCDARHLHAFAYELSSELDRHHIQRTLALAESDPINALRCPTGLDNTLNYIRSLGDNFIGIFVPLHHGEFTDFKKWIAALAQFGKPIVLLDHSDYMPDLTRSSMSYPKFFRLFCPENQLVSTALTTLHNEGHRVVGVNDVLPVKHDKWLIKRLGLIRDIAEKLQPPITITFETQTEPFWKVDYARIYAIDPAIAYLEQLITKLNISKQKQPGVHQWRRQLKKALFESIPSISKLLRRNITALLCLNDWLATNIYMLLRAMEIDVPRELSIISMDNAAASQHYPISTIDFGFERLGFYGAHIFINDIPIPADREGLVLSSPRLIDRGSITAPRKGPFDLAGLE
jgi:DNA-binding transcriptional regulator YhcF (GntR family)